MIYNYEYKGRIYNFNCKRLDIIDSSLKVSIRRKLKIPIGKYLDYLGFDIEKCRVCNSGYPPVNIHVEINNKSQIKIKGFSYKKLIYCYGENEHCQGIKMNPNSFEFISLVNKVSLEEAKILLKNNNGSPFYKENHNSENSYKEFQSRSVDNYIKKYGEELGRQKYLEHISKISLSNSREGYIQKYGEDLGIKLFQEVSNKKDSMSLDFFIKKNNGDLESAITEYEYRLSKVNNSISNLINKFGEKVGLEKHKIRVDKYRKTFDSNPQKEKINKSRAITIDNLLKKYGDIETATKIYHQWLEKVTVPFCVASKESLKIFNPLIDILTSKLNIDISDICIGKPNKQEYFIKDSDKIYFYDFTIRSKKIIIEYNGVLYHPKNENSTWTNPFDISITPKIAFKKQQDKIETAKANGFRVLEIWSDEENKLEKCLEFIKNNIDK